MLHNIVTTETVLPAARRRSPGWAVCASGGVLGEHIGSTARNSAGRGWATRAASSATTDTRPDSVPAHRPEETAATSVLSAAGRSPTPRGYDDRQPVPDDQ